MEKRVSTLKTHFLYLLPQLETISPKQIDHLSLTSLVGRVASTLPALQYGNGDTVACINIRFIEGVSRSGLGCGIYGVAGNLIGAFVPLIGGIIMCDGN